MFLSADKTQTKLSPRGAGAEESSDKHQVKAQRKSKRASRSVTSEEPGEASSKAIKSSKTRTATEESKEGVKVKSARSPRPSTEESREEVKVKSSKKHVKTKPKHEEGEQHSSSRHSTKAIKKSAKSQPDNDNQDNSADHDAKEERKIKKSKKVVHTRQKEDVESDEEQGVAVKKEKRSGSSGSKKDKKKATDTSGSGRDKSSTRVASPESSKEAEKVALQTRLLGAVKQADIGQLQSCLDRGADINYTGISTMVAWSPLVMAVQSGHADVVAYLLRKGADTTITNPEGQTAEEIAQDHGRDGIVRLFQADPLLLPQLRKWRAEEAWGALAEDGWSLRDVYTREPSDLKAIVLRPLKQQLANLLLNTIRIEKEKGVLIPAAPAGHPERKRVSPARAQSSRGATATILNQASMPPPHRPAGAIGPLGSGGGTPPKINVGPSSSSAPPVASGGTSWLKQLQFPSSQPTVPTAASQPGLLTQFKPQPASRPDEVPKPTLRREEESQNKAGRSIGKSRDGLRFTRIDYDELEFVGAALAGEGNFSTVRKGNYHGGAVAIKVLKNFDTTDEEQVHAFELEASLMDFLSNHTNVVKVRTDVQLASRLTKSCLVYRGLHRPLETILPCVQLLQQRQFA
eukprot:TRINITY_DN2616_c0_g1_i1.p1 TRINITY_DN2616_c0_g1~~TRINITY_DN2616_c0_g1_i1.p1  ORF type:complete len:631 (-),score=92.36 TRINITY_DN2616_c0_g1_i1:840-2732(-)